MFFLSLCELVGAVIRFRLVSHFVARRTCHIKAAWVIAVDVVVPSPIGGASWPDYVVTSVVVPILDCCFVAHLTNLPACSCEGGAAHPINDTRPLACQADLRL